MYYAGRGVATNLAAAVNLWQQAAAQGDASGETSLALFGKAAQLGSTEAQVALAISLLMRELRSGWRLRYGRADHAPQNLRSYGLLQQGVPTSVRLPQCVRRGLSRDDQNGEVAVTGLHALCHLRAVGALS